MSLDEDVLGWSVFVPELYDAWMISEQFWLLSLLKSEEKWRVGDVLNRIELKQWVRNSVVGLRLGRMDHHASLIKQAKLSLSAVTHAKEGLE